MAGTEAGRAQLEDGEQGEWGRRLLTRSHFRIREAAGGRLLEPKPGSKYWIYGSCGTTTGCGSCYS